MTTTDAALQSTANGSSTLASLQVLKNYLKKLALLILNIPFSVGLLLIIENRLEFDTPGYWVANRVFPARLGKLIGVWGWMGLGIDFVWCFAVIWMLWFLFLRLIREVEK